MPSGSFFQQVGQNAGNAFLLQQKTDEQNAEIALKQQQVQTNKMSMLAQERKLKTQQTVQDFISANQAEDKATVDNPLNAGATYSKAADLALRGGDFTGAKELMGLATEKVQLAKGARAEVEAKIQTSKDNLSTTADSFLRAPTIEGADAVAKAAIAAGVNPVTIPAPNTPDFAAWAKAQTAAALSGKDRFQAVEKAREFDQAAADRKEAQAARLEEQRQARADRAAAREESLALRREMAAGARETREARREARADSTSFKETEALSKTAQKIAEPYLKDRQITSTVKDLLLTDNSASDQQIRQVLPALIGGLKGRATNPYYKDNKSFGSIASRAESLLSHAFAGRYSQEDRAQISTLVNALEKDVIDPALTRIEADQKEKARRYKLNPDHVELMGDFNRADAPAAKVDDKGAPAKNPKATSAGKLPEGATESKTLRGQQYYKKDGQWYPL